MNTTLTNEEQALVQALQKKIKSILDYVDIKQNNEPEFRLREIRDRYLLDTITLYEAIPPLLRYKKRLKGLSAQDDFLEQINILNNAVHEYAEKINFSKDLDLVKNKKFLQQITKNIPAEPLPKNGIITKYINNTPFLKDLTLHKKPQELIKEQISEERERKFTLKAFEKTPYGNENYYPDINSKYDRPKVFGDYADYTILYAFCLIFISFVDTFLGVCFNFDLAYRILYFSGIDILLVLVQLHIISEVIPRKSFAKDRNYARDLAWLITIKDESTLPGKKREYRVAKLMETRTFTQARKEYQKKMNIHIQKSIDNGRKDYQNYLDAGVY